MAKEVFRQCCSCRKKLSREDLIKITLEHKTGEICVEPGNKTFGRSVYVCQNSECVEKAIKKKLITKLLKIQKKISEDSLNEKIRAVLKNVLVLKIY